MKTLLTIIGLSAALAVSAAEPTKPTLPVKGWQYVGGKLDVESFYTARFSGSFDKPQQGIGVGIGYDLTKNITASVRGVSYLEDPQGVNELSGRLAYHAPLTFISKKVTGYAFAEGGGGLQTGIGFGGAGAGLEYSVFKHVGLFAESDLRLDTEWKSSVGLTGGLKISF